MRVPWFPESLHDLPPESTVKSVRCRSPSVHLSVLSYLSRPKPPKDTARPGSACPRARNPALLSVGSVLHPFWNRRPDLCLEVLQADGLPCLESQWDPTVAAVRHSASVDTRGALRSRAGQLQPLSAP